MVNEAVENDHAFSIELDVAKLDEVGDRVLIEGHIGELIEVNFVEDMLEIKGVEGNMKINLNEKEVQRLLNTRRAVNRRSRL
jgi:hypothetical protein